MARKYQLDTPEPRRGQRMTLTKKQAASGAGKQLIGLLNAITDDGDISAREIQSLYAWLNENGDDFPALGYLRSVIETIAADGSVTPDEALDLYIAIERVLPADQRKIAKKNRIAAGLLLSEEELPSAWELDPMTDAQTGYLKSLGGDPERFATKGEASREIDRLLNRSDSVSPRQMMVLRFWNCVHVANDGKMAVIEWLDVFYAQDPDHLAAWNLWKEDVGDVGRQENPDIVPLGIGPTYLQRVKSGPKPASGKPILPRVKIVPVPPDRSSSSGELWKYFGIGTLIGILGVLVYCFWKAFNP